MNNNQQSVMDAFFRAKQDLRSLPYDYTPEMALKNNDVLNDPYSRVYNANILIKFIAKTKGEKPDYIRITKFGIDGPPVVSVLQYLGSGYILLSVDQTRYSYAKDIKNYIGERITLSKRRFPEFDIIDYDLITVNNDVIPIFSDLQRKK